MNVFFVVVATLRKGALKKLKPLDDANSWRAFSAWRMDEGRDVRAEYEVNERIVWNRKPVSKQGVA